MDVKRGKLLGFGVRVDPDTDADTALNKKDPIIGAKREENTKHSKLEEKTQVNSKDKTKQEPQD